MGVLKTVCLLLHNKVLKDQIRNSFIDLFFFSKRDPRGVKQAFSVVPFFLIFRFFFCISTLILFDCITCAALFWIIQLSQQL